MYSIILVSLTGASYDRCNASLGAQNPRSPSKVHILLATHAQPTLTGLLLIHYN